MSNLISKKCSTKKDKNIKIAFETLDVEPDYFKNSAYKEGLCHVTVQISLRVKFSDIERLIAKQLTQKDLQYIISKRIK
jgi:hypothetical protein